MSIGYENHAKIPADTVVDIVVPSATNNGAGANEYGIANVARAMVNGMADGVTFNVTTSESNERPSIVLNFTGQSNGSTKGSYAGWAKSDGTLNTGQVNVYLGSRSRGTGMNQRCLDCSESGYADALKRLSFRGFCNPLTRPIRAWRTS